LEDAARRANAAAAISVTRAGAGSSMPTKAQVETLLGAKCHALKASSDSASAG
jgi:sugar/nucleoside kinase (ribokinase family)